MSRLCILVLVISAAVLVLMLEWGVITAPLFDHEKLDVDRLAIDYGSVS